MATEPIDKDYVTIKVPKKIGARGIKRVKDFILTLEATKSAQKKVPQKVINELADDITAGAWEKLKQKRGFKW